MSKQTTILAAAAVALGASAVFASAEPLDVQPLGRTDGSEASALDAADVPAVVIGPVWLLGDGQREFFDDVARAAWLPLDEPTLGLCIASDGVWQMFEMDWTQLEARSLGRMGPAEITGVVVHELTGKLYGQLAGGGFLPVCQPAPKKLLTESRFDAPGFDHLPGAAGGTGGQPVYVTPALIDLNGGGPISPAASGGYSPPQYEPPPPVVMNDPPRNAPMTPVYEPPPPTDLPIWPEEGPTVDPRHPTDDPHAVPEPLSGSMLAAGAVALLAARGRRRKRRGN